MSIYIYIYCMCVWYKHPTPEALVKQTRCEGKGTSEVKAQGNNTPCQEGMLHMPWGVSDFLKWSPPKGILPGAGDNPLEKSVLGNGCA